MNSTKQLTLQELFVKKNDLKRTHDKISNEEEKYISSSENISNNKKVKMNEESSSEMIEKLVSCHLEPPKDSINSTLNLEHPGLEWNVNPSNLDFPKEKLSGDGLISNSQILEAKDEEINEINLKIEEEEEAEDQLSSESSDSSAELEKNTQEPDHEKTKKKKYKKQKRNKIDKFLDAFVKNEQSEFKDWLSYDELNKNLYCKICVIYSKNQNNVWADKNKGSNIFKKYNCEKHESSKVHLEAIKLHNSKKSILDINVYFKQKPGIKEEAMQNLKVETIPIEYKNFFNNIYWVTKEEIANVKIISLNKHSKNKLQISIPEYYQSSKSISLIIDSISQVIRNNILDDLKKCNYIGIMVDESSDVTNKEILLLYVRYYSKAKNKISELLLNLFELEKCDATYIFNLINEFLLKSELNNKIRFFCLIYILFIYLFYKNGRVI